MRKSLELSKQDIINVFRANFDFEITDTPLGQAVKMPAREAFLFCNVTGAGYLDNFVYPFTPKGLMKLFYNAFDYNFVTGVFEKTTLKNTPYILSQAKPFLFNSDYKYVVPVEFNSEIELQDFLESKFAALGCPSNYVVMRIEMRKKGHGLESFMEYLAGEYFKRKGFIVENQVPLAYAIGSPDFGGYDLLNVKRGTADYLPLGYHIIELAMLRLNLKGTYYSGKNTMVNQLIVGEAKTSTTIMDSQLRKYLDTGLFDWGTEMHPNKQEATNNDRGMFTLDDNMLISFTPPAKEYAYPLPQQFSRQEYLKWLENYMKFYLLANLTNDELNAFYINTTHSNMSDQSSLAKFVDNLSIESIIAEIKSHI